MVNSQILLNWLNFYLNNKFIAVNGGDIVTKYLVVATGGVLHTDGETRTSDHCTVVIKKQGKDPARAGSKPAGSSLGQSEPVGTMTNNQATERRPG